MGEYANRLAAVWAADIRDFDSLSARDTHAALALRGEFRDALRHAVEGAGGIVHRDGANGALAEFPSAAAALRAAVALLEVCDARVGMHLGEVVAPGPGELLGDGVTVAQRLLDEAATGELLISGDVQRQLRGQREFYFQPMGERLLRGLAEPVETFVARLRREDDHDHTPVSVRFGAWLRSRRTRVMFSVLGVYVAAVWTAVEVAAFVEARYLLTPNVTEVVLASMLLLLPSVLLVAYYHADPGKQRMPLPEKVGIPANVIAASIIVLLMFGSEDIGAVMQTVAVTDEAGATVERLVPKAEHRKRIALFPLEVQGGDDDAWLDYGTVVALVAKLGQDPFISAEWAAHLRPRLLQTSFPDGRGMPLSLQREIAGERHIPYFMNGTIAVAADGYTATVRLYDTARGRVLAEHQLHARDVFALSDAMADTLKAELGVPDWHVRNLADLPTSEVMTGSVGAMREYTRAITTLTFENDYPKALEHLQAATARDPTFANAHLSAGAVYLYSNQTTEAGRSFAAAMEHLYRLPERLQILVRHNYYYTHGDIERAFAVVDMGAELYPDDIMLIRIKAQLDMVRGRNESAVAMMRRILELDPAQHQLLHTIAQLEEALGRSDEAHASYVEYTRRFPESYEGFLMLADFQVRSGRHDQAAAAVQHAALLEPDNVQITTRLAALQRDRGDFDEAERLLGEALAQASSPVDRVAALHSMHTYSAFRGRMVRALDERNAEIVEAEKFQPPLNLLLERLSAVTSYVHAGRGDEGIAIVERHVSSLQPPYDHLAAIGRLRYALARDDADAIEAQLPAFERLIAALSMETMRSTAMFASGRVHELRGEHDKAIEFYRRERELSPTDPSVGHQLARCLHALGNHAEARRELEGSLRVRPMDPELHYTMALVMRDLGQRDDARRHLETALRVWSDADPHWEPARRARELFDKL